MWLRKKGTWKVPFAKGTSTIKISCGKKKNTNTIPSKLKINIKVNGSEFNLVIIIELRFVLLTACRGGSFTYCVEANSFTSEAFPFIMLLSRFCTHIKKTTLVWHIAQ